MADTKYNDFRKVLDEVFMLDQAHLDFGIYRIMNAKRDEITRFLEQDLLPQVRQTLGTLESSEQVQLKADLDKAIKAAESLGIDPELSPKVQELRKQYTDTPDPAALENEVFSALTNFFRRYYREGDFLSLRRYKKDVYALPYEGEEVKLHWANADQYYIKSSEYFRDYTFKLPDERRVHFKLVAADTEQNNNKPAAGQERRFMLVDDAPLAEEHGELIVRFVYRPDPNKRKQAELNADAARRILATQGFAAWTTALSAKAPTATQPNRTQLDKYLADYTARNSFDYFIHKDLGGFLRRELDFFIKNEIMHLDDLEADDAPRVEQYLAKVKAVRRIAHKIIDFLAQLENFQKKLWLKKKFVVETNYCVTLDRVPQDLYAAVAANDAQREEWVRLFAIDEIRGRRSSPDYSAPLTVDFLQANPFLVLDTKFFDPQFKERLLANFDDLDEQIDGLLVHSENFQALNVLQARYREQVKCIYIDPPYNTAASEILYKNTYKHSSWLSLMSNGLRLSPLLLTEDGMLQAAIDDEEHKYLHMLIEDIYGRDNFVGNIAIMHNPKGRDAEYIASAHEYLVLYAKSKENLKTNDFSHSDEELATKYPLQDQDGAYRELPLKRTGSDSLRTDRPFMFFPFIYDAEGDKLSLLAQADYDVLYDKRTDTFNDVYLSELKKRYEAEGLHFILPTNEQGGYLRWRWGYSSCLQGIRDKQLVVKRSDGKYTVYAKDRSDSLFKPKSLWYGEKYDASSKGTNLLRGIVGQKDFDYPKSVFAVEDAVTIGANFDSFVLDYFAGSGTTAHAVINLNRKDGGTRKYILAEMGRHFDTVLKPRIQKVIYSKDWRDGKPVSREGSSHLFKYIRLESYEDALNNLELRRTQAQMDLLALAEARDFREDYMLHYMLDVESRGSASLLNVAQFAEPFSYQLRVAAGSVSETRPVAVDLVETFNYLLGLRVKHIDTIRGITVVQGTSPTEEKVLILWRSVSHTPNDQLDEFFRRQGYTTRDQEFDVIYVNGDNNLENLRRDDETWKVRLIEETFQRLMFDVRDV